MGTISLGRVVVTAPKIVVNLARIKLNCKRTVSDQRLARSFGTDTDPVSFI